MKKITKNNPRKPLLQQVINLYPTMPDAELAAKLNVKVSYVRNVGGRFKLIKKFRKWSKKEIQLLLKYYEFGAEVLAAHLPNRTYWACVNKYREVMDLR